MRSAFAAVVFALVLCAGQGARAHPLSQGAIDVIVHEDRVAVRARVTLEEVLITDMLASTDDDDGGDDGVRKSLDQTYARQAEYLAQHLHVSADGVEAPGRVVRVIPPTTRPADIAAAPPDQTHVQYDLDYPLAGKPSVIELRSDVLTGVEFTPGVTWETSYAVCIRVANGPV